MESNKSLQNIAEETSWNGATWTNRRKCRDNSKVDLTEIGWYNGNWWMKFRKVTISQCWTLVLLDTEQSWMCSCELSWTELSRPELKCGYELNKLRIRFMPVSVSSLVFAVASNQNVSCNNIQNIYCDWIRMWLPVIVRACWSFHGIDSRVPLMQPDWHFHNSVLVWSRFVTLCSALP